MATQLVFKRGPSTGLANLGIVDGQLIFTVDNGRIYLDTTSGRIQMFKDVIDDAAMLKTEVAKLLGGKVDPDTGNIVADDTVASVADQIATAVATEKTRAETAEAALEAKIGTASVPETSEGAGDGKAASGVYIGIEKNAADIKAIQEALGGTGEDGEDASLTEKVAANTLAIEKLNGEATETGSVKKTVADAIAAVVADAPEDLNTLKEIADYIASDKTGATEINNKISDLEAIVGKEAVPGDGDNEDVDATGLVKKVADNTVVISGEITRAKAAEEANAAAIATLNGADTVEGSVKKAIKDAMAGENGLVWGDFGDLINND